MITTIIKTALGRSIMVQWDETSPRPYSRLNLIQGTARHFRRLPVAAGGRGRHAGHARVGRRREARTVLSKKYEHPLWKKMGEMAAKNGGHGGMDWLMLWRMVYCLRNGEPLDQDVYDAAAWSAIGPLSEKSIANRSQSVDVPDFTRGRWKTRQAAGHRQLRTHRKNIMDQVAENMSMDETRIADRLAKCGMLLAEAASKGRQFVRPRPSDHVSSSAGQGLDSRNCKIIAPSGRDASVVGLNSLPLRLHISRVKERYFRVIIRFYRL